MNEPFGITLVGDWAAMMSGHATYTLEFRGPMRPTATTLEVAVYPTDATTVAVLPAKVTLRRDGEAVAVLARYDGVQARNPEDKEADPDRLPGAVYRSGTVPAFLLDPRATYTIEAAP